MSERIEHDAVISLQKNGKGGGPLLRSRLPTVIIEGAGGSDKDSIHWVVTGPGKISGTVIKYNGLSLVPQVSVAPVPSGGFSVPATINMPRVGSAPTPVAQDDDEDEDFGDDGPLGAPVVNITVPVVNRPTIPTVGFTAPVVSGPSTAGTAKKSGGKKATSGKQPVVKFSVPNI